MAAVLSPRGADLPRSARRTASCCATRQSPRPMSTFPEYADWLVVEASDGFGAATLAAKLLADLGCPVARLEPPADAPAPDHDAERALFELVSRSKDSVSIDWSHPAAAAALDALLQRADVLVVDRPAYLRLQEVLVAIDVVKRYPRLTVCVVHAVRAHRTAGVVERRRGDRAGDGRDHVDHRAPGPWTDARRRRAARRMRRRCSPCRRFSRTCCASEPVVRRSCSTSRVYDAALAFQSASLPAYFLSGTPPVGIGNRHSMAAPWNSFRCADGWAIICAGNHPTWVRLCETIGRPDLLSDPRYATQGERVAHVDALEREVTAWTSTRTVAEVELVLNAGTIACGSVVPLPTWLQHPQFVERNLHRRCDAASEQSGGVFHLGGEPLAVRQARVARGCGDARGAGRALRRAAARVRALARERRRARGAGEGRCRSRLKASAWSTSASARPGRSAHACWVTSVPTSSRSSRSTARTRARSACATATPATSITSTTTTSAASRCRCSMHAVATCSSISSRTPTW